MAYLFYCTKTPSENFYSPRVFCRLSALGGVHLEGCALGAVAVGCLIGAAAAYADLVLGAVILRLSVVNAVGNGASDAGVYIVSHVVHGFILPELISPIVCTSGLILFFFLFFMLHRYGFIIYLHGFDIIKYSKPLAKQNKMFII